MAYKFGLVGESNYQPAIRLCDEGEDVEILFEVGNPYDPDALVAKCVRGRTIGYVGRNNWLRDAIHNEGKGCDAVITSIRAHNGTPLGVVLEVELNLRRPGHVQYEAPLRTSTTEKGEPE